MFIATVISPTEREEFTCSFCDLAYPTEHYQILLHNKKLAYFRLEESGLPQKAREDIPSDCLCHGCLYDILAREAKGGKELKIKFLYFGKERYGIIDPDDESGFY